ncbi:discoidin domain-containing protein [Lacticaseibacillus suibinensis]|uniref:discoidin domain-containing protein n=1 Tax=Lacticaseibacillus suibinensis TaxID=2486011 RepID=UPI0013DDABF9|nr:discoidin domain-containing protein [Lacticaseibacillus suibinensis]
MSHHGFWRFGVILGAAAALLIPAHLTHAADANSIDTTSVQLQITKTDGFTHPGISIDPEALANTRKELAAHAEPWESYYQGMLASPYASLDFQAANLKEGTRDVPLDKTFTSNKQEPRLSQDGFRAYTQSVLYYLTGNVKYRYNAIRLIRIWENMDKDGYKYYADAHIHAPVPFYYMVAAAELTKYTNPTQGSYKDTEGNTINLRWTDTDNQKLIDNFIDPLTTNLLINVKNQYFNQHLYALTGVMAASIFKDDTAAYQDAVEQYFVNAQSERPNINGALGNLMHVMTADDPRNPTGQDFVQLLEMGRDANHAKDDALDLAGLARTINNQGTKVDPTTGTISTAANAVDPYSFGNNRLLAGTQQFYAYNTGRTTPWIQVSQPGDAAHPAIESDGVTNIIDFGGPVSPDGRGRLNKFYSLSEVYDYYRYQEGLSAAEIAKIAPAVANEATHLSSTTYYEGTKQMNYWGAYSDNKMTEIGAEYWLSMPQAKAADTTTFPSQTAGTEDVTFNQFGTVLNSNLAKTTKEGIEVTAATTQKDISETAYDATYPKDTTTNRGGAQVALAGLVKPTTGTFAVRLKTNGTAQLLISASNTPNAAYQTLTLPDTKNKWQTVAYPVAGGNANIDFFTVLGQPNVKVTFAAGVYTDDAALPVIGDTARDTAMFLGKTLNLKLTATNATSLTLVNGPQGLTLAANGTLTFTPTAAGTYPVTVTATNGQRTVTKTFTITVENDRVAAYNTATKQLSDGTYTTASLAKVNAAAKAVQALIKTGSDDDFQNALNAYTKAIKAAELMNPTLADGSLAYAGLTTANLLQKDSQAIDETKTANTALLTDDNQATQGGDWHTPAVIDFGEDAAVSLTKVMFLARTGFPNRSQGTNLYGSNDGINWTKLTDAMTTLSNQPQTITVSNHTQYRYFKVQVDAAGEPTDPAYPGIADYGEIHLFGTRYELAPTADGMTKPQLLAETTPSVTDNSKPQTEVTTPGQGGHQGQTDNPARQGTNVAVGAQSSSHNQTADQQATSTAKASPKANRQTAAGKQGQLPATGEAAQPWLLAAGVLLLAGALYGLKRRA